MTITDLNHKNICILGFGLEGRATLAAIKVHAPEAKITVADASSELEVDGDYPTVTGPGYLDRLGGFDVIIKSPGIPWHPAGDVAAKLTSATELFLDSLPDTVRVIGVTGTKGKSTTSYLIYQVLEAAGQRVFLAGNIGDPMLSYLDRAAPGTTFVLELSSYQLETLRKSPQVAVVTSFFPDHLDYHGGLQAYLEAKEHIVRFQTADDTVFFNPKFKECQQIADLSAGRKIPFTPADFPGDPGHHNAGNVAAAYLVARHCGVEEAAAVTALENAKSLPHRQENLGVRQGITWVNDSAATTPQSTGDALATFGAAVATIIVGGLDRGYDFTELGRQLAASDITTVILFPDTGKSIREKIEAAHPAVPKRYFETADMAVAVQFARQHTPAGKICLLSSGSPSYNLFKNYPERGRAFEQAVAAL